MDNQDFAGFEIKFPRFAKIHPKRPIGDIVSSCSKYLFYDKKWLFSKESTWHWSFCEEMCGNGSKMAFYFQKIIVKMV